MRGYIIFLLVLNICIISIYGNCVDNKNCSTTTIKSHVTKIIRINKSSTSFKFYIIPIPIVLLGAGVSLACCFRRKFSILCCGFACCDKNSQRHTTAMPDLRQNESIVIQDVNNHRVFERKLPEIPKTISIISEDNEYVTPTSNIEVHDYEVPSPQQKY